MSSTEQFEMRNRNSRESGRESRAEKRESREGEKDPELAAAATLERADYLVKEVKSNKQQMQNIVLHMQQVTKAIQTIRQQLNISAQGHDPSLVQDAAQVKKLQTLIETYKTELLAMKDDLIAMQKIELQKQNPTASSESIAAEAERMVVMMIGE